MTKFLWMLMVSLATLVAALAAVVLAQEKITLNAPVFEDAGASEFRLASLYLNRQGAQIRVIFAEVNPGTVAFKPAGKTLTCLYEGATASTLIIQFATTNFSTVSMEKAVTHRCRDDGKIPQGTVTGSPQ